MIIYFAKISYGSPILIKVFVEKETPKTFKIDKKESVIGGTYYISSRVNKSDPGLFFTKKEALVYLISKLESYIVSKKKAIDEAENHRTALFQILREEK